MAPALVRDAVTVVLLHGDQLLLTQRNPQLRAFPGYHAFPGGKVDREDVDDPIADPLLEEHPPRLMRALSRELHEEVGINLLDASRSGAVESVISLGEATTPAFAPVRFRTWFYKVTLDPSQPLPKVVHEPGELTGCAWRSISDWWAQFERGSMLIAPPTLVVLQALNRDHGAAELTELNVDFDPQVEIPWIEPVAGVRVLMVRSNTLPPAAHTNAFYIGDAGRPRVIVDPSPASTAELERLCTRLQGWGVDLVFLTHHHPDHREFANEVARRFNVPIGLSADCESRIRKNVGDDYFESIDVRTFADGDTLTHWQGEAVRLLGVPGHDEGQLAPMPESRRWCIVGDLIQGVGTVVIAPPEGHMGRYFATLRKVIELDPKVIIPSHGIALGTTWYLQAALAHREERERVISDLHREGRDEDEILGEVYRDVDPRLRPLARINIQSHLQKLREDGVLG